MGLSLPSRAPSRKGWPGVAGAHVHTGHGLRSPGLSEELHDTQAGEEVGRATLPSDEPRPIKHPALQGDANVGTRRATYSVAHLGEGGHGHAVGPLLEGAGRLGGHSSGRCAIIGGWEGQVVLVQQIARAAAFPLLQTARAGGAGGVQGTVSGPRQPRMPPGLL